MALTKMQYGKDIIEVDEEGFIGRVWTPRPYQEPTHRIKLNRSQPVVSTLGESVGANLAQNVRPSRSNKVLALSGIS